MPKKKVIAVDLGGTNLRVAVVENNKMKSYIKKNTPKDQDSLIFELEDAISKLITKDIKAIGVGSPGPLENGIIRNPPNIPLHNYNLKKRLEDKFHRKVVIENDAHCAALSELYLGCKKKNFIMITLGTGVGGGIIINSKLYLGQGYGGEIGHIIIDNDKYFETVWQGLRNKMRKDFGESIVVKDLIKMKSQESNMMLEEITSCLGKGIASIINIFDPEVVVLAGGIKETGDFLLNKIRKETKKRVILPRETPIIWSKIEHPGVLGASLLVS